MSTPWPAEMISKIGGNVGQVIFDLKRVVSLDEAIDLLRGYGLDSSEMRIALEQVPNDVPQSKANQASARGTFNTAVWLLGASYRSIGRVQGVSHQTVHDHVKRRLTEDQKPFKRGPMPDAVIKTLWYKFRANPEWRLLDAEDLAKRLEPYSGEEDEQQNSSTDG